MATTRIHWLVLCIPPCAEPAGCRIQFFAIVITAQPWPTSLREGCFFSRMAQVTFANVSNKVIAFNAFKASFPQAVNHGISTQFPDTVCVPKVCRNALARNSSPTRPS